MSSSRGGVVSAVRWLRWRCPVCGQTVDVWASTQPPVCRHWGTGSGRKPVVMVQVEEER
jgi:hypothetical protein